MIWFGLTLVLLALLLAGVHYAYKFCFYSPVGQQNDYYNLPPEDQYVPFLPQMRELIGQMERLPYEAVTVKSHDGLTLAGKYYHVADGAPLAIFFHGYRSTAFRDGCGGCQMLMEAGMNVLMVDQRAHRDSGGHTITFGIRERQDVKTWAEYAVARFGSGTNILLFGVSMGAATVLMSAELDLPKNVKAIVADCPYRSVKDIIINTGKGMGMPAALYPAIRLGGLIFGGFDPSSGDAGRAVAKSKLPILIIHGLDDRFVPQEMSLEIQQANPNIRRETFPDAAHGISFLQDRARYTKLVIDFCEGVL